MPGAGRVRSVDVMTNITSTPETAAPSTDTAPPTGATPAAFTTAETTAHPTTPQYPTQPAYPAAAATPQPQYYPTPPKTNLLGIVTLVLGILGFGIVPVITGHIALGQIKRSGEDGRGITLAGLILGYVTLAGWLLVAFFWIAIAGVALIGSAAGVN